MSLTVDAVEPPVPLAAVETPIPPPRRLARRPGDLHRGRAILLVILAAAAVADGWGFASDGIHAYYGAAVRSMSGSWSDFFFGAFDPQGTISLDKLPGGFWLQALVVRLFGLSTPTLVLPQVVAGVAAVYVLYRVVRRTNGQAAALIAAAVLATMPVAVLSVRGNVPDGICVLLLVLAADATLRAARTGRWRSLVWAAVFVGLAFQVKMVEAWLIVPGIGLAFVVAAPGRFRRRAAQAAAGLAILVAVSLSWMTVVSLVPAGDRPYVDGSSDNSVFMQVFVYNGVDRIPALATHDLAKHVPYRIGASQGTNKLSAGAQANAASWDRLATGPVGRDAGWLLALALCVAAGGLWLRRRRPRTDMTRAALLLWGGWLIPVLVVFSASGTMLAYYLGMLAPPIAALAGIGAVGAYRNYHDRRRYWPLYVLLALVLLNAVPLLRGTPSWFAATVLATVVVGIALCAAGRRRPPVAMAGLLAAILIAPAVASADLVAHRGTPWDYPFARGGTFAQQATAAQRDLQALPTYGGTLILKMDKTRWTYLRAEANAQQQFADRGVFVVFETSEASNYILGGADNVVPIGGYTGLVNAPTLADLTAMLDAQRIEFALLPPPTSPEYNDPRIQLLIHRCARVAATIEYTLVGCQMTR